MFVYIRNFAFGFARSAPFLNLSLAIAMDRDDDSDFRLPFFYGVCTTKYRNGSSMFLYICGAPGGMITTSPLLTGATRRLQSTGRPPAFLLLPERLTQSPA